MKRNKGLFAGMIAVVATFMVGLSGCAMLSSIIGGGGGSVGVADAPAGLRVYVLPNDTAPTLDNAKSLTQTCLGWGDVAEGKAKLMDPKTGKGFAETGTFAVMCSVKSSDWCIVKDVAFKKGKTEADIKYADFKALPPGVMWKDATADNCATIIVFMFTSVTSFDGETVGWAAKGMDSAYVGVTPGEHSFTAEGDNGNGPCTLKGSYNFEAGKSYYMVTSGGDGADSYVALVDKASNSELIKGSAVKAKPREESEGR